MKILFVHQNFPGQYVRLAPALASRGHEVTTIGGPRSRPLPGIRHERYRLPADTLSATHGLARDFEAKMVRAEAVAGLALKLRQAGYRPDLVLGHSGWGETVFLKDVWPDAKLVSLVEFVYGASGADVGFDPEFSGNGAESVSLVRGRNAAVLLAMDASDSIVAPTKWQASRIPPNYSDRTSVIHDGIDTTAVRPDPAASISLARDSVVCRAGDEIVTFVARNLEPYRGFHSFMRALPEILEARPKARAVIVGGDGVSYGQPPPPGQTWKAMMLAEVGSSLDMSRVHFVGQIPYGTYVRLLQVSAAHVYLTYPFVLSWSMLEAMAAGCLVIGSATPPVQEVLRHGENGLLVDFFSPDDIAGRVIEVLETPRRYADLRDAARGTAKRYDFRGACLPRHLDLLDGLMAGRASASDAA